MADSPRYADVGDDAGSEPDRRSTTGTPRWVIVFGVIALVVVLLFVILLLVGGGHSPRRHTWSDDAGGWHVAANLTAQGVQQR